MPPEAVAKPFVKSIDTQAGELVDTWIAKNMPAGCSPHIRNALIVGATIGLRNEVQT